MKRLSIDMDFYNLTVPITEEQQEQLEKSILNSGCLEPIITWEGMIIDGHKRYLICDTEEIDFETEEVDFPSREKAMIWVCRRRMENLEPGTPIYKYLYGKWSNLLKPDYKRLLEKGIVILPADSDGRTRISRIIAKDMGSTYAVVERYSAYANTMDKIAKCSPTIFRAIIEGRIKVTLKETRALAHNDEETKRIIQNRLNSEPEIKSRRGRPKKVPEDTGISISMKIKEMPAFDPDMEIRGLALTIPTWMTAIARAEKKTDMKLASKYVKRQLTENLLQLEKQIQVTLEALECTEKDF